MSSQPEYIKIVKPWVEFITWKGWKVHKTHGSMYQVGFPDLRGLHKEYSPKWMECKLMEEGSHSVSFTRAQKIVFPEWLTHGDSIWIIAHHDLRGNRKALEEQYNLLFKPCNCWNFLNPVMRKLMYG